MTPDLTPRIRGIRLDNPVPLRGQLVQLPTGQYDWLHLELRATLAGTADCWLYYVDALDPEPLSWAAGERVAVRVPVARRTELDAVRLPVFIGAELVSLALVAPAGELVLV
ncbi:hypothetical protein GCM10010435_25220 [Winogradskya consettensis]|uniref:Uncharacterized protein n=1 Tax=Winogradskya consettensis TaxID=113560 RepID=A0A919SA86_9ACTN|nr:hypothetical protein [Actinoplanes consettensis]GIM67826.1 hypothetical protein Aco04nite_08010 [Actinoplanes consettensis]